jgi:repressor LexA
MTDTERLRGALEQIQTLAKADAASVSVALAQFARIQDLASAALAPPPPVPDGRPELTGRQAAILRFIEQEVTATGRPPTTREIGQQFGISSPNGVRVHLLALARKGYVRWDALKSRTLSVVGVGS